jgi:hypothetical protein
MITSALISQCRREFGDVGKTTQVSRAGDGVSTVFNVGKFPVIEGSYTIFRNTSALVENSGYTYDLDNGDLTMLFTPTTSHTIKSQHKYAHWRDKNWVEAINQGIEELNARGFFRQVARNTNIMRLSANVRVYSGPSACIDLYEVLESDNFTISGNFVKLGTNWSYQQDANKLVLGLKPTQPNRLAISYLRNMRTYAATSATLDVANDWIEAIKKFAGAKFYRSLAGKIATQGAATVDEGHFSFTNLRTQANDLLAEFDLFAKRKKPTRPAKDMQYHIDGGGIA